MSTDDSDPLDETNWEGLRGETEDFEDRIVDLLEWVFDTRTRAQIYLHLRRHPNSTSREIARETELYPSTVREELAELHGEGAVGRTKREASGAGNNPYEYEAISSQELIRRIVDEAEEDLNTLFRLDEFLSGERSPTDVTTGPVTIDVVTNSKGASANSHRPGQK